MHALCKPPLEPHLKPAFIGGSEIPPDNGAMWVFQRFFRRSAAALLVCSWLGTALAPAARASDDDHDQAQRAVLAGEVMPLRRVLERLEREQPGQVLDVELEREDSRWVYEIKLLQPSGQRIKLTLDARSAELLERRERPPKR
jgi:uncharacterized membrane protein YkoI